MENFIYAFSATLAFVGFIAFLNHKDHDHKREKVDRIVAAIEHTRCKCGRDESQF